MNELLVKREKCTAALLLLGKFFSEGIFNEEEATKIARKIAQKYGFKIASILVSNQLISTLINESMYVKKDTILNGN